MQRHNVNKADNCLVLSYTNAITYNESYMKKTKKYISPNKRGPLSLLTSKTYAKDEINARRTTNYYYFGYKANNKTQCYNSYFQYAFLVVVSFSFFFFSRLFLDCFYCVHRTKVQAKRYDFMWAHTRIRMPVFIQFIIVFVCVCVFDTYYWMHMASIVWLISHRKTSTKFSLYLKFFHLFPFALLFAKIIFCLFVCIKTLNRFTNFIWQFMLKINV